MANTRHYSIGQKAGCGAEKHPCLVVAVMAFHTHTCPAWVRALFYPCSGFLGVRTDYPANAPIWQPSLHCFMEPGCLMSPSIIFRAGNSGLTVEVQIRFSCRPLILLAACRAWWLCREQDHCEKIHHQWRVLEYICLHRKHCQLPAFWAAGVWLTAAK